MDKFHSKDFGELMESLRESYGYSLQDVSNISDIDRQYIHRIEKGKVKHPSYPLLTLYVTRTYPLSPNHIADMAKLWDIRHDDEQIHTGIAGEVEAYAQQLPIHERHNLVVLIRSILQQHKQVRTDIPINTHRAAPWPDKLHHSAPDWLRRRLTDAS